ncbi:response regulator [Halomonas sp. Mc5H-6]|uniref:phosphorylase family protein n=1 Tax=Halomonas sp. Mc5H-6 TaxID=2954500 RepID=UPI0020979A63|nr:response regulator [Halomonas sp. Mc5H-6]MCO7247122.1 hypothetical protein [Halomonas sp. Mc5H-6]
MIRVLVVDDNYSKTAAVAKSCHELSCEVECCHSAKEAIKLMREQKFELLIVDLQIPNEIGGNVEFDGGENLAKYCAGSDLINKPLYIIGMTSHLDSFQKSQKFFNDSGWPLVLSQDGFVDIKSIIENKASHSPKRELKADVAVVTALYKVEFEALLDWEVKWEELHVEGDSNVYYTTDIINSRGKSLKIVATSCSRMGMVSAAATTMKLCEKFNPEIAIMVGIAAGVEGKANVGDILVADPCWDWGSGKSTVVDGEARLLSAPHQIQIDPIIRAKFQRISTERKYLDAIATAWPANQRPSYPLNLIVGPVASGAVVLENTNTVRDIVRQHRETIGVEMEAYGFSYAISISSSLTRNLVVKSVCDFANLEKNDDWQAYAAYTSAQLTYMYIVNEL